MTGPAPAAAPRRGRQRSLAAQSAVLEATCRLLERSCLRGVTTEAIARLSGVSKATIYKWWPNKAQVALDAFLASMTRDVPTPDTGSALTDFQLQLKSLVAFYTSAGGRVFGQFMAEGQSDPVFLALFRERFLQSRRHEARLMLGRGLARGELRAGLDPELVLDLLYGPVIFRLLAGHGPLDDRVAEQIVATVFAGIRATAPPA